jgi:hypothetical protein
MTVTLTIQGEIATVLNDLETLLAGRKPANVGAAVDCPAPQAAAPTSLQQEPAEPAPKVGRPRKKAPAADAVIEQKAYEDQGRQADRDGEAACAGKVEPQPGGMTLDQVREFIRGCNTDGHLECVEQAMQHFGLKKTSDMDPDAGGKPSAKFAEYVAKIQQFIDAKAANAEGGE